tara:strand:+ start:213 stop:425 length:213 start_codon:yes stop_codon:yes gene_type:complete
MKIKKLIELLKDQPQNNEVLLSKDSEGNLFKEIGKWAIELHNNKSIIFPNDKCWEYEMNKKGDLELEKIN